MGFIYCFTNLINNKKYVGQSINNNKVRYNNHYSSHLNPNSPEYNSKIHQAFRKYGFENFSYTILARDIEDPALLDTLEIYYIEFYDCRIPKGYNLQSGGSIKYKGPPMNEEQKEKIREKKGFLSVEEVIELRKAYQNHESPKKIFDEKYKDKFTHYNSFLNIWTGKRYENVMPEVFIDKGRHTKLNKEIAAKIKKDRKELNLSYGALAKKYNISKSTISDIIAGRTWKNV